MMKHAGHSIMNTRLSCEYRTASVSCFVAGLSVFMCVSSHYKKEAAQEARYIKDRLAQELGAPVFLDSDGEQLALLC
jgi:hypothetical protein